MALAKKCDACGKLYEHYSKTFDELEESINVNGVDFIYVFSDGTGAASRYI